VSDSRAARAESFDRVVDLAIDSVVRPSAAPHAPAVIPSIAPESGSASRAALQVRVLGHFAIILDGKLWTGASGFAGEVGHITIDAEGLECVCGNTGCLETVASAPSIVRRARERLNRDSTSSLSRLGLNKNFTADDVAHAANEGDDFALMMIERTGKYIGTGVATVINLLNIERIVLGGGVMDAGALILNPIIQEVKRRAFLRCFEVTEIVAAKLGPDAAPIGAALLARDAAV